MVLKYPIATHSLNGDSNESIIFVEFFTMIFSLCRNYNAELFAFGNRLGEKFEDNFLREALTNKSYIEGEASRMNEVGLQLTLAMKSNEELSVKGQQQISKFVKGYLRAILTKVPEEMIM